MIRTYMSCAKKEWALAWKKNKMGRSLNKYDE